MIKKGIILAGGTGSRLNPLTKILNKQLLPLYDKPLIFYSLSVLMLAGIRNILIIVNQNQKANFQKILGDGKSFGVKITYKEQKKPSGLPDAFVIGENFIKNESVALILGDNFFYGQGFTKRLRKIIKKDSVSRKLWRHEVGGFSKKSRNPGIFVLKIHWFALRAVPDSQKF